MPGLARWTKVDTRCDFKWRTNVSHLKTFVGPDLDGEGALFIKGRDVVVIIFIKGGDRGLNPLKEFLTVFTGTTVFLEQFESTFASLVAFASQKLQGFLASSHLFTTDNATMFVFDQIFLFQTTGGMFGSTVEDLSLGANSLFNFGHLILFTAIIFRRGGQEKK